MIIAVIGLLLCLVAVFFQDWKYRHIHVALPVVVFAVSLYLLQLQQVGVITIIGYNAVFFLVTLSILTFYMSLKNKQFLNPFQNYFGLGDLLFYVAITPLFLLHNYILFFILSMVFAVLMQIGLKKIIQEKTVPLAGFSSLFLILVIAKDLLLHFPKFTLI